MIHSRARAYINQCIDTGERMTKHTVAAGANVSPDRAQRALKECEDAKMIRTVDWERVWTHWLAIYSSQGKRMPRPKPLTRSQITKRHRDANKDTYNLRHRLKRMAAKGKTVEITLSMVAGL